MKKKRTIIIVALSLILAAIFIFGCSENVTEPINKVETNIMDNNQLCAFIFVEENGTIKYYHFSFHAVNYEMHGTELHIEIIWMDKEENLIIMHHWEVSKIQAGSMFDHNPNCD